MSSSFSHSSVAGVQARGCAQTPPFEVSEHGVFDRATVQQPDRVDAPLLAEAVDAADPLLEPQRIPRQLDVDHQAAPVMQVEALAGCVGRDQQIETAVIELAHQLGAHRRPEGRREARRRRDRRPALRRARRACRDTR